MTIFKTVKTYKTDAKPESFWKHGIITCLSLGIGTVIYALITDMKTVIILERIFFQSFAILFFCFIMSKSYKLYSKSDEVEQEVEIKEVQKEANFNF